MKTFQLTILALMLHASSIQAKVFRKNVITYELGSGATIDGKKITYNDPDCEPDLECIITKTCAAAGTAPTLSEDEKYFSCCMSGQRLLGSPETAFDCCAEGHDLVGCGKTGYHCCPIGMTYDGKICKVLCENGKVLVDGKCVCPEGTVEASDGTCKSKPKTTCSSGLESGKCYIITAENGNNLGLRSDGVYYAAPDSAGQRYGKFQLCADEKCTLGTAINPSDKTFIKDIYGDLATGLNPGQWLNNAANGAHIGRTQTYATAGQFGLSKWPCGKYCLSGFEWGVGPACPAEIPALTFYPNDPQMCTPFTLTEVPCDIKADENNCIWKNGNQCCNKIDCSGAEEPKHK